MFVYNLLVRIYGFIIRLSSIRNAKAQHWIAGRKNWKNNLKKKLSDLNSNKRIWIHCASYGEFEQGRPLIEAIKQKHPEYKIVLTFFSPSGYEAFHNWKGADVICYLPLDTPSNAKNFVKLVSPQAALFIKYEFWVNVLLELKKQNIPSFLVSAVFKPHHPFFKWYGGVFRNSLKTFTELFIQDEASAKLLKQIGIQNYEICGDTRFDRVSDIKNQFKPIPYFEEFCRNKKIIIAGSSWPKDEEVLIESFIQLNDPELKLIFAPHNIDQKSIQNLEQLLTKNNLPYSLFSAQKIEPEKQILIVDAMGLLSKLYHYADIAYIGGGFNSGIHNCLEPAVYLKPIVFCGGDYFHKFNEAVDLLKMGAAKNISTSTELESALTYFLNDTLAVSEIKNKLDDYFRKNSGTTERVLGFINWD
jgi:3-deoxy-D-manno-octulosonic-acid transferase